MASQTTGKQLKTLLIVLLNTLLLAELCIYLLISSGFLNIHDPRPERKWEERFIERYENNGFIYHNLHQPHEQLGWSLKPNLDITVKDIQYNSNSQGFRGIEDFAPSDNHYNILVVGDSFTFGDGVSNEDTWPAILQHNNPAWNVMNLATTAYGTDQMLLSLQAHIKQLKPNLVIVAFIDDNMIRSQLNFRDYKKPRFKLADGVLELSNTPIGQIDEVYQEIKRRHARFDITPGTALLGAMEYLQHLGKPLTRNKDHRYQLNQAIFNQMHQICQQNNAELLVAPLITHAHIKKRHGKTTGLSHLKEWFPNDNSVHILATENLLTSKGNNFLLNDHYSLQGNKLIANAFEEKINTITDQ